MLLLLAFSSDAQSEMLNAKYRTDILIGSSDNGWSQGQEKIKLEDHYENPWGYFLQLNEDGTFVAFNQNKCGNDCRIKVRGTYLVSENQIEFFAQTLNYMDVCATRPKKELNESLGVFSFIPVEDVFYLKRMG